MRNRQFSYDEGDEDYYDDEDEAAAACEEHRLSVLQARGEAGGSGARSGGKGGGGVSLSSYFDLPDAAHQLNKQKPQLQQSDYGREDHKRDGTFHPGNADGIETADADEEDAELVAAIAEELERRLGKDQFSSRQVRMAVIESGYEVDTAEAILATMTTEQTLQNAAVWARSRTTSGDPARAGLAPLGHNIDPSCPPSALAFGLCVDGQGDWRQVGTAGTAAPPGFGSVGGSGASSGGGVVGVEPFGFDTPSPDDLNLYKQSGAGRKAGTMDIGGGLSGKGNSMRGTAAGGGAEGTGTPQSRGESLAGGGRGSGRKASVTSVSSPKANVVHIGTGSTPGSVTRKSIVSPTAGLRGSALTTPTRGVGSRDQSPTGAALPTTSPGMQGERGGGGGAGAKVISSLQAAGGAGESDEGEAGGKERLTMVVIGHVDAGKSTLMGQVIFFCFSSSSLSSTSDISVTSVLSSPPPYQASEGLLLLSYTYFKRRHSLRQPKAVSGRCGPTQTGLPGARERSKSWYTTLSSLEQDMNVSWLQLHFCCFPLPFVVIVCPGVGTAGTSYSADVA